jgi:hypothetical protein
MAAAAFGAGSVRRISPTMASPKLTLANPITPSVAAATAKLDETERMKPDRDMLVLEAAWRDATHKK